MLNKMQQLRQGAKSVEEYYQELQMGMLRCNFEEEEEYAMARFLGELNREIQDILAYKDYTNITRLFHLACKAEREVQGDVPVPRLIFLQGGLIRGSPARLHILLCHHPVISLVLLLQIQRQRQPKHLLRVLLPWHLQVEQGTFSVTGARDMDM
jgi:hypothetical protein